MSSVVGTLVARITSQFDDAGLKKAETEMGAGAAKMESRWTGAGKAIAAAFSVAAVIEFGRKLQEAAEVALETERAILLMNTSIGAAQREFGDVVGSTEDWAATMTELRTETGLYSERELASAIARTVDMTKRLGLEAEQMKTLLKRTTDITAGKTDLVGGIERVTAALRGEAESAEFLGLTLNEDYIKTRALAEGLSQELWPALTDVEKAQLRYNVFLEQTNELSGQAVIFAESQAGRYQEISTRLDELTVSAGKAALSFAEMAGVMEDDFGSGLLKFLTPSFFIKSNDALQDTVEIIEETVDGVGEADTAFEDLVSRLNDLTRTAPKTDKAVRELNTRLDSLYRQARAIADVMGNELVPVWEDAADIMEDDLGGSFEKATVAAQDFVNNGIDPMDIAIAMLGDSVDETIGGMTKLFTDDLGEALFTAADFVKDFTGTAQYLLSQSGGWGLALSGALELAKAFGLDLNKIFAQVADSIGGLLGISGGPSFGEQLANATIGQIAAVIEAIRELLGSKAEDLGLDVGGMMSDAVQSIIDKVAEGLAGIDRLAAAHAEIGTEYDASAEKLRFLEDIFISLSAQNIPELNTLLGILRGMIDQLRDSAEQAIPAVEGLGRGFQGAREAIRVFADEFQGKGSFPAVLDAVADMADIASGAVDDFNDSLKDLAEDGLGNAFTQIMDEWADALSNASDVAAAYVGILGEEEARRVFLNEAVRETEAAIRDMEEAIRSGALSATEGAEGLARLVAQLERFREELEEPIAPPAPPSGGGTTGGGGVTVETPGGGSVVVRLPDEWEAGARTMAVLMEIRELERANIAATLYSLGGDFTSQLRGFSGALQGRGFDDPWGGTVNQGPMTFRILDSNMGEVFAGMMEGIE